MNALFSWFENRVDPFPAAEPVQPPGKLLPFCWHYTKSLWPWLLLLSVTSSAIALTEVLIFSFLGRIVDWLTLADRSTFFAQEGPALMLMGLVILFGVPLLSTLNSLVLHQTILGNFPMIIRWQGHRRLLRQSMEFYQDEFAGRVATKVMQAALGVRETVVKALDVFVYVSVYFLGALVLVASLNFTMMLPFLLWLTAYVACMRYFLPRMRKISERQSNARSTMTGRVVDSYTNIMTVKLFAHGGREQRYAKRSMEDFLDTVHPQMRLSSKLNICLAVMNALLLFLVGLIGLLSWQGGLASIGGIAVALGLVLRLEGLSHWVMWELASLFENIGMAEDGMETLARPQTVMDAPDVGPLLVHNGAIDFDTIRFNYGKDGGPKQGVVDGLSLKIKAGEKVGIVGRSGAGKSTLMNLLLRLYDLESGKVSIDGQDIARVQQDSLREQIGVVTQDTSLLHRSVRDNIAYGRPVAADEEVIEAAKRAKAHEYILDLIDPEGRTGYDAHVGERGVKLSGGQRQRVAIARMFLKDAPILVLDEATSALDSEVEQAIQDNLHELMEGKTVIAIAHRLSTIAAMDRLIVLEQGKILEEGTHEQLIASGGLYAQLWARQSGGFLELD